jgi:hypothetical protein
VPYYVDGSESLFDLYRIEIDRVDAKSLMYSLDPAHNRELTGTPSKSRIDIWKRTLKAKSVQTSSLQGAGASVMHGMANAGAMYAPQSVFDKLDTATSVEVNRNIARDLSKLINLTLQEQDVWEADEKCRSEG